jgi:flagellar basal-body rod modification protein FlgD
MPLNSVSAVATTPGSVSVQDFLKILLTELNSQNPLKPMDNTAFVAQLAQFTQLQQTQELSTSVRQLVAVQTGIQTVALLGHDVDIVNGGALSSGKVTEISLYGTDPTLTVHPTAGADVTGAELGEVVGIR